MLLAVSPSQAGADDVIDLRRGFKHEHPVEALVGGGVEYLVFFPYSVSSCHIFFSAIFLGRGVGHCWPGTRFQIYPCNKDLDAIGYLWDFFTKRKIP
ncbi:MAG: hypothetical protein GY847_01255 [Proteobacteria bacterium]|nr:hypothetical protein [Pseudomonadota bacterium]